MTTDIEWEKWGARDPYFSVLTNPKFRADALTDEGREEFFALGRHHVEHVLGLCRAHIDGAFAPQRVLDFGCGVGRLVLPFAAQAAEVVGVDISPSMLAEAQRNCDRQGLNNVVLALSDDTLSAVQGQFDLVHTCIVIQHIEIDRGLKLFEQIVRRIAPGGLGAMHVTFAWDHHAANHGVAPPLPPPVPQPWWLMLRRALGSWLRGLPKPVAAPAAAPAPDPEMQMNFYNMSQLLFVLQRAGASMVHTQLTDHGGAIGAFMFFRAMGPQGAQPSQN